MLQQRAKSSRLLRNICRRKFLRFFPGGFQDETYLAWERDYKWQAHQRWEQALNRTEFESLMQHDAWPEIAARAVQIESRTNLLFSFEKMALRDAVRTAGSARLFAQGLYDFLYHPDPQSVRFARWCDLLAALPRRQTRVLTWPVATVFSFLALPSRHIFVKPKVTRLAARNYGFPLEYESRPNWKTYSSLLGLARLARHDLADLHPRDMIDMQSFLWVQGSDEYD